VNIVQIIDDDKSILEVLGRALSSEGYEVKTALSPTEFLSQICSYTPAVVICDIFFGQGEMDGEALVKIISDRLINTVCIMISGETDIQKTLSCIRNGAIDFIDKPVSLPRLLTTIKNALLLFNTRASAQSRCQILGKSTAIQNVMKKIQKLAQLNENVLICGESGTGKELVAANLHLFSKRYTMSMIKFNCTALNPNLTESELFGHKKGSFTGADTNKKGYFESAHQSSLFIDEIGDFSPSLQSKILRVLQDKKVIPIGTTVEIPIDVRFIFATHQDLGSMIKNNTFREDLYFRIATFTITLPPLRERIEDIDILAPHFLTQFLSENSMQFMEFSNDALSRLKEYHYPGNIRELTMIIKNAAMFSDDSVITPDDIDFTSKTDSADIWQKINTMSFSTAKKYMEKEIILKRLALHNNDLRATSESLGLIKNNLYRLLRDYEISYKE
jgi:DNA-binding NtrC family response regulator